MGIQQWVQAQRGFILASLAMIVDDCGEPWAVEALWRKRHWSSPLKPLAFHCLPSAFPRPVPRPLPRRAPSYSRPQPCASLLLAAAAQSSARRAAA